MNTTPPRPAVLIVSIFVFASIGCATPTTGIVPRGEGLHSVTRQGEGFWVSTDALKTAAILEADAHCIGTSQRVKVVHTKEIQAGAFGRYPESEVLFRCE